VVARWLCALWLVWMSAAQAQPLRLAPLGPNQLASRDLEVRFDRLPDQLPADQIEVVVEASDEYCKPKTYKVMGITLPVPVMAHATFFCQVLEAYGLQGESKHRPRLSRQIWQERDIASHVAQLDVPPSERYLALTRRGETRGHAPVPGGRWVPA
jgi:hypothetical protein